MTATPVLIAGASFAAVYGAVMVRRAPSLPRTIAKTAATVCLAIAAFQLGGPVLLIAALGLSALGDAFLAMGEGDAFLLPGMGAFFAAHVAYVVLFWQSGLAYSQPLMMLAAILVFAALAFLIWLRPKLGNMQIPVLAYGAVIAAMGALAIHLPAEYRLATWGAMAFIASDAILSLELFVMKPDAKVKAVTSPLLWALYWGGQALILLGMT